MKELEFIVGWQKTEQMPTGFNRGHVAMGHRAHFQRLTVP